METEQVVLFLKNLNPLLTLDYELQADTGVEVEELTPQRLDEILQTYC